MKILFITIGAVYNFNNSGAYTDLLKCFAREGHEVFVVGAIERRIAQQTNISVENGINVLRVKIGNITKTNLIEKGISTLTIGKKYEIALQRYWANDKFDLILYTTPPITIASLVKKLKKKYNAYTYLLLKDIFPQNAIDIGILSRSGIKGGIYHYFKLVEKKLYSVSDKIGCMSEANRIYVITHNNYLEEKRIEVCPNTIDVVPDDMLQKESDILKKYSLPEDKKLILYGGNFGKPQNVEYIINAINGCERNTSVHFVLCGSGTEFYRVEAYMKTQNPKHVTVIKHLPYAEYAKLVSSCHIGLLFLDYRFTIPNFPSRLLDYMNYGLPIIAATDTSTDVGDIIVKGDFGWWVGSDDPSQFSHLIKEIFETENINKILEEKSKNARKYLINNFETKVAYNTIMNAVESNY